MSRPRHAGSPAPLITRTLSLLAACAAFVGCVDGGPPRAIGEGQPIIDEFTVVADEAAVATRSQALHGPVSVDGCRDARDQAAVRAAVDFVRRRVTDERFLECLRDSYPIGDGGASVERMVDMVDTDRPVQVSCRDNRIEACGDNIGGWKGCASIGAAAEAFTLDLGFIADNRETPAEIGGTILHELMHVHGFNHRYYVGFSVPDVVDACLDDLRPAGTARDAMPGEVTLAHIGGDGGEPEFRRCGDDEFAVGLRGQRLGGRLSRLSLTCATVSDVETGAPRQLTDERGRESFAFDCRPGSVLMGLSGYDSGVVEGIAGWCSPLDLLRDDRPGAVLDHISPVFGRRSGLVTRRLCRNDKAIVGLALRQGNLVDRVEVECDGFPRGRAASSLDVNQPAVGGGGGSRYERLCGGDSALVGLFGSLHGSGWLSSLGGECAVVSADGRRPGEGHRTPEAGIFSGQRQHARCPEGEVIVGAEGRAGAYVAHVDPLCVDYAGWLDGAAPVAPERPEDEPASDRGDRFRWLCPRGKVATGFTGRDGALIDRFKLRCAAPTPATAIVESVGAGGRGGDAYRMRCPGGGPLTGIATRLEDLRPHEAELHAVGGDCGLTRDGGTRVHDGYPLPLVGAADGITHLDRCDADDAIVGFRSQVDRGIVRTVAARCAPLDTVRAGDPATYTLTERGRHDGGWVATVDCPAGQVALGLDVRAGARVDRMGLLCGWPDLVAGETWDGWLEAGERRVLRLHRPRAVERSTITARSVFEPVDIAIQRGRLPGAAGGWRASGHASGFDWRQGLPQWTRLTFDRPQPEDHYFVELHNPGDRGTAFELTLSD